MGHLPNKNGPQLYIGNVVNPLIMKMKTMNCLFFLPFADNSCLQVLRHDKNQ